jgi:hypothetical protein
MEGHKCHKRLAKPYGVVGRVGFEPTIGRL